MPRYPDVHGCLDTYKINTNYTNAACSSRVILFLGAMDSVKLLGGDINKELNFGAHVGRIC